MNNTTQDLPDGDWDLDPAATTITVTATKMSFMTVPATLDVVSGRVTITDGMVSDAQVVADAASYTSSQKMRDKEVRGSGFLNADQHPTITFSATSGSANQVDGQVSVKGKDTPATFAVSRLAVDGDTATFTATMKIDRSALGISRMPAFVIGNELSIEVAATAAKSA